MAKCGVRVALLDSADGKDPDSCIQAIYHGQFHSAWHGLDERNLDMLRRFCIGVQKPSWLPCSTAGFPPVPGLAEAALVLI